MTDPSKRYWITEQGMKEAAAEILRGVGRCPICGWTLAGSADKGCVIGNCSYRPERAEWDVFAYRKRRAEWEAACQIIAAHSEAASPPELSESEHHIPLTHASLEKLSGGGTIRFADITLIGPAAPPQGTPATEPDRCICWPRGTWVEDRMCPIHGRHSTVAAQKGKL